MTDTLADPQARIDYVGALKRVARAARVFLKQTVRDAYGYPGIAMCELDDAFLALDKIPATPSQPAPDDPDTLADPATIPADTLDDLRWQSEHPAAIVHMDKPTLRALLAAYERESQANRYECDCCGAMVPREQIANVIAYGIETAACSRCRGCEEPDHLHDAIIALTRACEHTRWGCSAQDYVHRVAADALRRAGRVDLATRCEEVDGPHGAARILAELEAGR